MSDKKGKSHSMLAHEVASSLVDGNGDFADSITTSNFNTIMASLQDEISVRFQPKKEMACHLADVYALMDLRSRAHRVADCGTYLEYYITADNKKLHMANFCKDRLCPMCNWRRSLKIYGQVSSVMDVLESQYSFLFLTLTVRNCSSEDLPDTVQALFDGWRKLYRKKFFKQSVCGTFRSLEITRNATTGQFHPHLHVVLAVRADYYSGRNYISQALWCQLWKDCCGLDYDPVVDIRKIKPSQAGLGGAVAEVSKYAVKSSDFLHGDMDDKVVYVSAFLAALSKRRLCAYTGCFAEVRQKLELDDVENGDLVHTSPDTLRSDVAYMIVRYYWKAGVYVQDGGLGDISPRFSRPRAES